MIADSGNPDPIVSNKEVFDFYYSSSHSAVKLTGNGQSMTIAGAGTLNFKTGLGNARMENVLYVPTASHNLLSISRLADKGVFSIFGDIETGYLTFPADLLKEFIHTNRSKVVLSGYRDGSLYKVDLVLNNSNSDNSKPSSFMSRLVNRSMLDWHLALNHLNITSLKALVSKVTGLHLSDHKEFDCIACMTGKAKIHLILLHPIIQRA